MRPNRRLSGRQRGFGFLWHYMCHYSHSLVIRNYRARRPPAQARGRIRGNFNGFQSRRLDLAAWNTKVHLRGNTDSAVGLHPHFLHHARTKPFIARSLGDSVWCTQNGAPRYRHSLWCLFAGNTQWTGSGAATTGRTCGYHRAKKFLVACIYCTWRGRFSGCNRPETTA